MAIDTVYTPVSTQVFTLTGSSQATTAFSTSTAVIRVVATENAHIDIGPAPIATASKMFIAAGIPEYFAVHGGKAAVIQGATGGVIYITEMSP